VRRLPIRLRVTLAFSVVIAIVLGAVGLFLYLRMEEQLNESIDTNLRTRSGEVSALVQASDTGVSGSVGQSFIEQEESFAQVLTSDGRVVDSTPQLQGQPVLSAGELTQVGGSPAVFERKGLPGIEGEGRLLATELDGTDRGLVVVVGSSLQDRDEALSSLTGLLLIGGPVALLLASLAGYGAASTALRPVEAMRTEAAAISASRPDARLPVPPAGDELTRLGETLNAMLSRLEEALERERRFVDDASHELRTPLALHKTELELALAYGDDPAALRKAIGSAVEEIDRLIQLAEDLLVVARVEEGKLAISPESLSVADLFETVGERFRGRAAQSERKLVIDRVDGLSVEGDRLRLEQALTSMVDNALRHGAGDVLLRAEETEGCVRLHVADRGGGFPPDFLDRAFERFSRAAAGRSGGGSGLGLAIVETIAHAHGGHAGAANDPAGGADVWIEIPCSVRSESPPEAAAGPG
jgi:signal transduction histidine kinase